MLQVFMAPAIGCYCQVITSLVDQVSRDLDWWIFLTKLLYTSGASWIDAKFNPKLLHTTGMGRC